MNDDRKPIVSWVAPSKDFDAANPAVFARAESPDAVQRLASIESRTAALKERLGAHLARFEAGWTAREATALLAKHAAPKLVHPPPRGVLPDSLAERLMEQARRNVRARATQRLTALNLTKVRMQDEVVRPPQKPNAGPDAPPTPKIVKALRRKGP